MFIIQIPLPFKGENEVAIYEPVDIYSGNMTCLLYGFVDVYRGT